ncbi:hypothetical protein [Candidatus Binatus sp.]|jgi:hypothetical protein|uniref:hypothetical protein n=1 Tax=Candidatus Binatus sp. TaxID=2811406 RepID=UPI003BE20FC0
MDLGVDGRRLALEAITTLVHLKNALGELILKPAGVSQDIYRPLFHKRDLSTGRPLSKRQIAPLILDAVEKKGETAQVVRAIIEITANWNSFHLADDEYAARATVQKARELLGILEDMEARESAAREQARKAEVARMQQERVELFEKHSSLLLMMLDSLETEKDHHRRGYLLQDLINRLFDLHQIPVVRSFTRNQGGEQIDGAFKLDGWHYLVECRWRQKLADIRQLDGLKGQIDRSGKQTMGLFLSIEGWSDHVPGLLKQNPEKSIILMDGYDLRVVLDRRLDLSDLISAKVAKLNLEAEPYHGVREYLSELGIQ